MYSRYSNISIPENYSGNRFSISEPETKTHRGELRGASRTTHSPSFIEATSKLQSEAQEIENHNAIYDDTECDVCDNDEPKESTCVDCDECDKCKITEHHDETENKSEKPLCVDNIQKKSRFDFSSIKSLLSGLDTDTLVILGLIILLMSDSDKSNDDVVAILALLLLN
ncbi:MAG: hypothetical protein J6A54_05035 [Clostridia bacterium]|nr:hypothetical protein [Clostridia bacterium]